jgi:hypothetical protein
MGSRNRNRVMSIAPGSRADWAEVTARLTAIQESINRIASDGKENRAALPLATIDPTLNVKELVELRTKHETEMRTASEKRQDDLREMERHCKAETDALREQLKEAESKRLDAVNLAESRRLDAGTMEQKAAIGLASEKVAAQAATLAAQVVASATTIAQQMESMRAGFDSRITRVEQQRWEAGGASTQRVDTRQLMQWFIGIVMAGLVAVAAHFWK